ncbi:MAG: DUF2256 domain-containing protein [Deltaproteobacteria bacterium]|nr:DUF2256 domain-containing protein [Deltaproteobacteria bacterium]
MSLPSRICAACRRPFAWRRKWARDWHAVRYCSDACRSRRGASAARTPDGVRDGDAAPATVPARRPGRALPRGRR